MSGMNNAISLRMVLDNNTTIFELGDTIQGMVIVDVRNPIHCNKLVISNTFKTHGRGNGESQHIASLIVFEGEWQPGRYQYPFSFTLPSQKNENTPASFYGHYVNVTWHITAMADFNYAYDKYFDRARQVTAIAAIRNRLSLETNPQAEANYTLISPAAKILTDTNITNINDKKFELKSYIVGCLILSPFLIWGLTHLSNILFNLLVVSLFIILFRTILEIFLLKKFGVMQLTANESVIGNRLNATLKITPKKDIMVSKLYADLIYEESATSGSGSSATTHKHEKVLSSMDLTENSSVTLNKNTPKSFDLSFPLSEPLTATLHLKDNHITYKIEIVAKVGNRKHEWSQDLIII